MCCRAAGHRASSDPLPHHHAACSGFETFSRKKGQARVRASEESLKRLCHCLWEGACQPSITKVKSCAAAPGRPHSVSISLSFCFSPPEPSSISHLQEKYFFVVCKSASMPQSVLGSWTSQVQAVVSCHFLPLPNLSSSEDCPKPTAVLVSALLLKVGCVVSSAVEDVHFLCFRTLHRHSMQSHCARCRPVMSKRTYFTTRIV